MAKKFLSREEYLDKQRQAIIEQSLENSRNRTLPTTPYIITESEKDWNNRLKNNIGFLKLQLQQAIKYDNYELIDDYNNHIDSLNKELLNGYVPELCPGASCIYTATDNYGKKYRVSGNKTFRANPEKYGFKEINLNDIRPGDIIQDFGPNGPRHALTFVGYDDTNKALFNYSKGGSVESEIIKNGYYPFEWDDMQPTVHLDGINNSKLQHAAAAYRFVGNEDDNKVWNENYNKERSDWSKQVVEELKQVPTLALPNRVQIMKFGGMKQDKVFKLKGGVAIPLDKANKLFYLSGAKHEQGGIDVTPELEAEGGEVVKINPKSIKVVTAQKIMGDKSPAELVVDASSTGKSEKVFNKVFNYQENFKDRHNLNDDGTKKAKWGIMKNIINKFKNKFAMGGEDDERDLLGDVIMKNNIQNAIDSLGIDEVRRRLYRGFSPIGYDNPNERFKSAMSNKEERRPGDEVVNDIWAEYLHIPKEERYKPASQFVVESGDASPNSINNKINYTLSPFRENLLSDIIKVGEKLNIGENQTSKDQFLKKGKLFKKGHGLKPFEFRNFTIGRGRDDKGDYVSYYDLWDLNPLPLKGIVTTGEDAFEETGVGTPIDFYDKIYLDDYYKLNEEDKGKPWITPAIVKAKKIRKRDRKKVEKLMGGEIKNKKKAKLGAADWVNIGINSAGALTNLITGLTSPDTKYARMKDPIPIIAPKINSNVNTTAEENAIDQAYHDEIRSINENTADSKVALNRIRNAGAKRAASKVKIRSNAENTRRDLINKGNILKGEYDRYNIGRQENVDAYNAQAKAAEFNANKDKVGDAISGFIGDLMQGASTITNTLEKREADRNNAILTALGYPEINPQTLDQTRRNLYRQMYLQDDIDRLTGRKTKIQSKKWSDDRKTRVTKRIDNRINKLENF